MPQQEKRRHVEIRVGGRLVAAAEVEQMKPPGVIRASLHVESGHLPTGTRSRLVDAVLDVPELRSWERLEATIPMGDTEILQRIRERCGDVQARAAGATCILDADPKHHYLQR